MRRRRVGQLHSKSCCFHCERRMITGKSGPTAARTALRISAANLARSPHRRAAEAVVALVGAFPEELVDQIAVRAVQLDGVEAQALGVGRRRWRRRRWRRRCRRRSSARRTCGRGARRRRGCRRGRAAPSPRGGCGCAPTCHSCGAIRPPAACTASITPFQAASSASPWKRGMFGIVERGGAGDAGALGDDQPDLGLGAAGVVGGDLGGGDAARRLRAGHGGHDDAVGQIQALEVEGLEQGVGGQGRLRCG